MKIVNFEQPFWLLSDTHFFHSRLAFDFGLRTELKTIDEMNERIFNNWNNVSCEVINYGPIHIDDILL